MVVSKRHLYAAAALLALASAALGAGTYLWLNGAPPGRAGETSREAEDARFATLEGEVRVVRAETRETVRAGHHTRLLPGDTVQTQADGRATVTLADGSTLSIRPDSVITIAENAGTAAGRPAHVRLAVEGGQVRVQTGGQPPEASNVVETPLARNRVLAQTSASFDVRRDESEEVRVSSGAVERGALGAGTTISAGEYVAFDRAGGVSRRERLLDTPVPYAPANREIIEARAGDAEVTLQWTHPMAAAHASYRVEIASSPFFVRAGLVFERERLVAPRLTVTGLQAGDYFWRVRAFSQAGQGGEWCERQRFTIFRGERRSANP